MLSSGAKVSSTVLIITITIYCSLLFNNGVKAQECVCPNGQFLCELGTDQKCCTNGTTVCDRSKGTAICVPCTPSKDEIPCCKGLLCNCCKNNTHCDKDTGKCSKCQRSDTPCCSDGSTHLPCKNHAAPTDCCSGEHNICSRKGRCVNKNGCTRNQIDCCNIFRDVTCIKDECMLGQCRCCEPKQSCVLPIQPFLGMFCITPAKHS